MKPLFPHAGVESLERYCRNVAVTLTASVTLSLFLAIALWARVPHSMLLCWLGLVVLTQALQWGYAQNFLAAYRAGRGRERHWMPGFLAASVLTGWAWSTPFFFLNPADFSPMSVLLIFVVAGVNAYAGVAKSAILQLAMAFEGAALLPLAAWLLLQSNDTAQLMGVLALLYFALLYVLLRQIHALIAQNSTQRGALEDQLQMKSHVLDHSSEAVYLVEEQGRFVYVNQQACRQLGYSRDELLAMGVPDIDPDYTIPSLADRAEKIRQGGGSFVFESRHKRRDGTLFPVEILVANLEYNGQLLGLALVRDITERKNAQSTLAAQEAEFRALAENSPDAIFRYDREGLRTYVNPAVEQITGKSRDELVGKPLVETALHPDIDSLRVLQCVMEVARTGERRDYETTFVAADGQQRTLHKIFVPEFSSDGSVQSVLGIGRDISAIQQTQEALRRSEQLMRAVLDATPDWIFVRDREHRYHLVNKSFASILHLSPEDFIGKNDLELGNPEELVKGNPEKGLRGYWADDDLVMQSNQTHIFADDPTTIDGVEHTFHTIKTPLRDPDGKAWGMLAFVRNISDRKQIERTLAEREAFLETLLDAIAIPVFYKDREGRYLGINLAFEQYFGVNRADLMGKSVFDTHPRELALVYHAKDTEVFERKVVRQEYESHIKHSNGTLRDVMFSKAAFTDARGEVKGLIGAVMDITERKQAENELREQFDQIVELNERLGDTARQLEEQAVELEESHEQLKETEAWYRSILQSAPDGMMVVEGCGQIALVNKELERMFGYGPGELVGQSMEVLLPLDIRPVHVDMRKDYFGDASRADFPGQDRNLRARRKDGSEFMVDVTLSRLPGNEGKPGAICAAVRDVTERRRAQLEMAETRSRLKNVLHTIPDLVWLKNTEGQYLACNPAFERFFGASEADIVGKTDHDFVGAELADFFRRKDLEAIEAGTVRMNEEWVTYADSGMRGLLETRKVPVFNAEGQVTGVLGVARDITERKRMEDELRRKEHEFRTLVDSLPDPFFRYDRKHRRTYVNAKAVEMTGQSAQDLLGKSISESQLATTHWNSLLDQRVQQVLESGKSTTASMEYQTPNGDVRHFDCWLGPVFGHDGTPDSVMLYMRDITEIKTTALQYKQALELTESIINAIPDLLFEVDGEGRFFNVWAQKPELLAAPKEVLLGRTVYEMLPPDAAQICYAALNEAKEKGLSVGKTYALDLPHGKSWFELSISRKSNGTSSALHFLTMCRDVTERKRLELEVAQREHEFRTLVENATDTVARYGKDMRRLYANPAFAQLVEGGTAALLGKKPSEVPGGAHAQVYENMLAEVLAKGQEAEFELKWYDKEGRELCSLISLTPEFAKDGTVETVLAVGRDISELNTFRQRIHQMAFYDTLTALPNRALFNDRLRQMITDASWHHQLAGVMLLDMDRFKVVNDTMGHAVGDELLRETGQRLSACLRTYDTVARLGGDEFAMLLPDVRNAEDLGSIADKMRSVFEAPFLLDGKEIFVSCSIGIALYPNDSTEADDLLRYADSAMYLAKRSGRNNFRFYSRDLTESANERLTLESDMRRATERGELELYYQPKVRLSDARMVGSEALLRWKHPVRGMITPDKFIPVAEDSGLIIEIGAWVLREACRTACELNGPGKPLHKVAINLSARQFMSNDLVATVRDALHETGCQAPWIELEITESLLLDEDGDVLEILTALRSLGITIAIDDFGTGYSALSYLARFPINTLKIDRSFVRSIEADNFRAELVKAILSIAHCLKQQVVAEGVETPGQAAFLQAHACQIGQGYLFSKPVPKADLMNLPGKLGGVD